MNSEPDFLTELIGENSFHMLLARKRFFFNMKRYVNMLWCANKRDKRMRILYEKGEQ